MKSFTVLLVFLFASLAYPQPHSKILFQEDFKSFANGSDGSPAWIPVKGAWQIIDGKYFQQNPDYDCASFTNTYINQSFDLFEPNKFFEVRLGK
jgi:hypothetical protein